MTLRPDCISEMLIELYHINSSLSADCSIPSKLSNIEIGLPDRNCDWDLCTKNKIKNNLKLDTTPVVLTGFPKLDLMTEFQKCCHIDNLILRRFTS